MRFEEYEDRVQEVLIDGGFRLIEAIKAVVPVKTGALRDSIQADIEGTKLSISALGYFDFLEDGTIRGIQPHDLLSETEPIIEEVLTQTAQFAQPLALTTAATALETAFAPFSKLKVTTTYQ